MEQLDLNFNIQKAYNGQEALDIYLQKIENKCNNNCCIFKFIIMDIDMPILNGLDTVIKIREIEKSRNLPHINIIGQTGFTDPIELQKYVQ